MLQTIIYNYIREGEYHGSKKEIITMFWALTGTQMRKTIKKSIP